MRKRIFWVIFMVITGGTAVWASMGEITDMNGKQVQVELPLERIALFSGPSGQWAFVMHGADKLCAINSALQKSTLIREMTPRICSLPAPRATNGQINIEELIMANPQLVISGTLDGSIVEKKTRIPVAYLEDTMGHGFDFMRREARFYGKIFNSPERANKYIAYLEDILKLVRDRTADIPPEQRKTVFHGFSPTHLVTLGGDTFVEERIQAAGCINVAAGVSTLGKKEGFHTGLNEVSMEQVLGWNPDILIIDYGEIQALKDDPRWAALKAVKSNQVYRQPVGIFIWSRPTAESAVLHPLWLAKIAYSERMADVSFEAEVKRFYSEIMDFNLSDEQTAKIVSGRYESRFRKNNAEKRR